MENLSISGNINHIMLSFFRLVAEQQFPLDNISLHLWTEVVKWFSCSKTCSMRYSEESEEILEAWLEIVWCQIHSFYEWI